MTPHGCIGQGVRSYKYCQPCVPESELLNIEKELDIHKGSRSNLENLRNAQCEIVVNLFGTSTVQEKSTAATSPSQPTIIQSSESLNQRQTDCNVKCATKIPQSFESDQALIGECSNSIIEITRVVKLKNKRPTALKSWYVKEIFFHSLLVSFSVLTVRRSFRKLNGTRKEATIFANTCVIGKYQ